jgi:hypothetical protein
MMSSDLEWLSEFERTPESERQPYPHGFQVSQTDAFKNILSELRKFDNVAEIEVETAAPHNSEFPNIPRSSAEPDDPWVVVSWKQDGQYYVAPCDRWDNLRDNAQAIYHYLSAKRGMNRWGVGTTDSEFVTQRVEKEPVNR